MPFKFTYQKGDTKGNLTQDADNVTEDLTEIPIRRNPSWFRLYMVVAGICVLYVVANVQYESNPAIPVEEEEEFLNPNACDPNEYHVVFEEWSPRTFSSRILLYRPRKIVGRLPLVVFAHGTDIPASNYKYLYCGLANKGYFVAASDGPKNFFNYWESFAKMLSPLAKAVKEKYSSNINNITVAGGHSAGGGSALFAASGNKNFNALFLLAPYTATRKQAVLAAENVIIPTLVIAAQKDNVVNFGRPFVVGGTPQTVKDSLPNITGKDSFVDIPGAAHCGFCFKCQACHTVEKTACEIKSFFLNPCEWIPSLRQENATMNALIPWLKSATL